VRDKPFRGLSPLGEKGDRWREGLAAVVALILVDPHDQRDAMRPEGQIVDPVASAALFHRVGGSLTVRAETEVVLGCNCDDELLGVGMVRHVRDPEVGQGQEPVPELELGRRTHVNKSHQTAIVIRKSDYGSRRPS
jgi:hypothetical protein